MTSSPLINALAASAYVALVATGISNMPPKDPALFVLGPLLFLSLFVFSAGLMGFLFFWQPALLVFRGDARGGLLFFLKTLGLFALVTIVLAATITVLA